MNSTEHIYACFTDCGDTFKHLCDLYFLKINIVFCKTKVK